MPECLPSYMMHCRSGTSSASRGVFKQVQITSSLLTEFLLFGCYRSEELAKAMKPVTPAEIGARILQDLSRAEHLLIISTGRTLPAFPNHLHISPLLSCL
jgi:hypothetical protein